MIIVQDAIAQIKSGVVTPSDRGKYFILNWVPDSLKADTDLQKILVNGGACEACALGVIFAEAVILTNGVKTNDDTNSHYFQLGKLLKWFSEKELDMIETAYEGHVINDSSTVLLDPSFFYTKLAMKCMDFGRKYETSEDRMVGILKNILKHQKFTP